MTSFIIYLIVVWSIPLTLLGYGLSKKNKKFIITGIILIPIFIFVMPILAIMFFGGNM